MSFETNERFFEFMAIAAGWMGTDELAVQTLAINTLQMMYFVPMSISIAVSIHVGNFVGAGNEQKAKAAATSSLWLGVFIELLLAAGLFFGGSTWAQVFTNKPEIVETAEKVLRITSGFIFCDGLQVIAGGILCGVGAQNTGLLISSGFVFVTSAICYVTAFYLQGGIVGLWEGLWIGGMVKFASMMYFIYTLNWSDECCKAMLWMAKEEGKNSHRGGTGYSEASPLIYKEGRVQTEKRDCL